MLAINQQTRLNFRIDHDEAPITLLFFNGATLPLEFWDPVIQRLGQLNCVRFDQRNAGRTEFEGSFSLNDVAADAAQLLKHLDHKEVIVVGHAWGGRAAQVFARDYPHLTRALIICGTGGQLPPRTNPETLKEMATARRQGNRQQWEDALHKTFCARNFRDNHPHEFEATATTIWNAPIPRGAKWDTRISPSLSYWGTCDKPVLLLYGTEDKNGTRENAEDLHDRLSDSRLHYIDDTGHFVVREAPDAVVNLICAFLGKLSAQKPTTRK